MGLSSIALLWEYYCLPWASDPEASQSDDYNRSFYKPGRTVQVSVSLSDAVRDSYSDHAWRSD